MRKLIGWLVALFLPGTGNRRVNAAPPVTQTAPPNAPTAQGSWAASKLQSVDVLRGEDVQLVRPYLIAFEQRREAQRQLERRTALVLASCGIDYQAVSA